MQRVAAPTIGGMVTSAPLTLLVIPVLASSDTRVTARALMVAHADLNDLRIKP